MENRRCRYHEICGLILEPGSESDKCILHSDDPNKDKQAFQNAIETHLKLRGNNFGGFVFPEKVNLNDFNFSKWPTSFFMAKFLKGADFRRAKLYKRVDFTSAEFPKGANFYQATFSKSVSFNNATFSEWVNFNHVIFSEGTDFHGATFSKGSSFGSTKFHKGADFRGATFSEGGNFGGAEFVEKAYFIGARFHQKRTYFGGTIFSKGAEFGGATFSEHVGFAKAKFTGEADFNHAEFTNKANFFQITFSDAVNFNNATFSKRTDFRLATFSEKANLSEATFSDGADFNEAKFSRKAEFGKAIFYGDANFNLAKFYRGADFSEAMFSKEVDFSEAMFSGEVNFAEAMFSKGVTFKYTLFENGPVFFSSCSFFGKSEFAGVRKENKTIRIFSRVEISLENAEIDPLDALSFQDADLSQCQFSGTDLRMVKLTNVLWKSVRNRISVYDEIKSLEENKTLPYPHIERIYRQLKKNYEDQGDSERAGEFHYSEKEMRRKNPDTKIILKCLLTIYWIISGYGERYLRPLLSAGVLLFLCTFAYLALGIGLESTCQTKLKLTSATDWGRTANYSLQVMTLQKPTGYNLCNLVGNFVRTFQSIFGPITLGLFALAVRQRLKR